MALVTFPPGIRGMKLRWTLHIPQQSNKSGFTSRTQVVGMPGAEHWLAAGAPPDISKEKDVRIWRAFFLSLRGAENTFHLPALPTPQGYGAEPTVSAAVAGNRQIDLSSAAAVEIGMMMTIVQVDGHHRLVGVVGKSGNRVSFEPYLTANPTLAVAVKLNNPYAVMRMTGKEQGWADAGSVDFQIDAEEAL